MSEPRPKPWTTVSSRIAFDDRWLRIRADDCVTAEGTKVSPYFVLEAPDFVHAAALTDDGRIVMVRQYRQGTKAIHLELPAGTLDPTDSDGAAAAARELREETGYAAEGWRELACWSANPARQGNKHRLYIAANARRVAEPAPDGAESLVVALPTVEEALEMALSGGIDSSFHVAAVLKVMAEIGALKR